ncbi:MAG TPA: thiamine phosphate synthase [Terriglobales bacterium]|nr:thiamine phosphate synthase [Terriglobales bacterium]
MSRPLLYYITDRTQFPGDESTRRARLLAKIGEATSAGVDYIQLREKDLPTHELESLAREAMQILKETQPGTARLLINSRTDIALAVGADGVHLPAGDLSPAEVRQISQCGAGAPDRVTISLSCHSPEDVHQAQDAGADLALFAPVFEKKGAPGAKPAGVEALRQACQYKIPVLALGGITADNAAACLQAGAAGIAAIRLFQQNDVAYIMRKLLAF